MQIFLRVIQNLKDDLRLLALKCGNDNKMKIDNLQKNTLLHENVF